MKKTIDELRRTDMNKLDVYVNKKRVAILTKEHPHYVLTYLPGAVPSDFVSLTMPVRAASWVSSGKLHPFFETNLPEGLKRAAISEMFGKAMVSEAMSLLALTGSDTIGRVFVVPAGFDLEWKERFSCDIDLAVHNDTRAFFADVLSKFATQGVSGVQPKALAIDSKITVKTDSWVIKHDSTGLEWMSANEHLSMTAAKMAGLNVADTILSDDGMSIFVKRFDIDDLGNAYGFEDFCGLMGLSSVEKYSGSMEKMAKIMDRVVTNYRDAKKDLMKVVIFNLCIGNSDAHLKNFGVIYRDTESVAVSPFYDIVSVRAFDAFKSDIPALTIGGKKEWTVGKVVKMFAFQHLGLNSHDVEQAVFDVARAVEKTIPDVISLSEKLPGFRDHAKRMVASWSTGIRRINGQKINYDDNSILSSLLMSEPDVTSKTNSPNPYKPK